MAVLDKLTHTITIHPMSSTPSLTGEPTFGTPVTGVACYISRKERRFVRKQETITTDIDVIFGGGVSVELGWLFSNGLDVKGATMCNTARVENLNPLSHPNTGMKIKLASATEI